MYAITTTTIPVNTGLPNYQGRKVVIEKHRTRHIALAFKIAKAFCEETEADHASVADSVGWQLFECRRKDSKIDIIYGEDINTTATEILPATEPQ